MNVGKKKNNWKIDREKNVYMCNATSSPSQLLQSDCERKIVSYWKITKNIQKVS